jgi:manganese transport protein
VSTDLEPLKPPHSIWRRDVSLPSMVESFRSIPVSPNATYFRRMLTFFGPGYLVAVGYMDPGSWATSLAAENDNKSARASFRMSGK